MSRPIGTSDSELQALKAILDSHPVTQRTFRQGNILGMLIGGLVLLGGFFAFFVGLSGNVEWVFQSGTVSAKLINASPGAVFSVVGMIIMLKYKPRVKTEIEIRMNRRYLNDLLDGQAIDRSGTRLHSVETQMKYKSSASSPVTSR
jgi:hypothetical protein